MAHFQNRYEKLFQKTLGNLHNHMYDPIVQLDCEVWTTKEPIKFKDRKKGNYKKIETGQVWGELWDCGWFNFKGKVPEKCKGEKIALLIDVGGEGCLFDEKGAPVRGLTNINSTFDKKLGLPGKRVIEYIDMAVGVEKVDVWVEAGTNDLFGNYIDSGKLKQACIAVTNVEIRALYYDYFVLLDFVNSLPENSAQRNTIFYKLKDAALELIEYTNEEAIKARYHLASELNHVNEEAYLNISAIGHAHMDLAWLWPIRETKRKCGRTFSTVLNLMDRYDDYLFGVSQPQQLVWLKEEYPELYGKFKKKILEGKIELQGPTWVEMDTNLVDGESLVRQFLYGIKFYEEEFDKKVNILWLPDAFGFSAALPQIMKKCRIDYFMTQKMCYNKINEFPHNSFIWKGIDGTEVLVHFPPENTYNSPVTPSSILKTEHMYSEAGLSMYALTLFGIGDGGGGPGLEHLERLERVKKLKGLPAVKQEFSKIFFAKLNLERENFNVWEDELYLEDHQGTFTTAAKAKWYNRKIERLLREVEFAGVLAKSADDYIYPAGEIEEIWKELLLYQFHDILPGSSIKRVYDECLARYEIMYKKLCAMIDNAYGSMGNDDTNKITAFNSLSWQVDKWIENKGKWAHVTIPSCGYSVVEETAFSDKFDPIQTSDTLENNLIRVAFNTDGTIASIFDKDADREVLERGKKGNELLCCHDTGNGWDYEFYYREFDEQKPKLVSSKKIYSGPNSIMRMKYEYNTSQIYQDVILERNTKKIIFKTKVDFNEEHVLIKARFPLNVFTHEYKSSIQYGNIARPTHRNTVWDYAKQEICVQKWIDLSNGNYGAAILNDSKYGHSVDKNIIDINLLRSTTYPGYLIDQGCHEFTYALLPHIGNEADGKVEKDAYELNSPLHILPINAGQEFSFIQVDNDAVIVDHIKKAEKGGAVIIRLYESTGCFQKASLSFGKAIDKAELTDLCERKVDDIELKNNKINIALSAFEITTIAVYVGENR